MVGRGNVPGWTEPATLSPALVTDSEALSRVDFWESGVRVSETSVEGQCLQTGLRVQGKSNALRRPCGQCQTFWWLGMG